MYLAHAGHIHMDEPLTTSADRSLVVVASLLAIAVIVGASLYVLSHLSKRHSTVHDAVRSEEITDK